MQRHDTDRVVIVGAGPTGLTLASELARAGVPCTVVERRSGRSEESRALGLHARTLEMLDLRGVATELVERGHSVRKVRLSLGHKLIDLGRLDSRFPYLHILPQSVTEEVLEEHARGLGAEVVRNTRVIALHQDDDGVTVRVRQGTHEWDERAAYVVGCDGAHSAVRNLLGVPFRGKTYPFTIIVADVRLEHPPHDDLLLQVGPGGIIVATAFGDGWYRMGCIDRLRAWSNEPVTMEEVRATLARVAGRDLGPSDPRWMSRFRIQERHADRYRVGRVLLAGDAAHLHSPLGGQGLNVGIQDAMNLGWKLVAEMHGWGVPGILDSYEAERRPVAARIIKATDVATYAMTTASPRLRRVRGVVAPIALSTPHVQRVVREHLSGVAVSYRPPDGRRHRFDGRRLPDRDVVLANGRTTRVAELLRPGRFVLLDFTPDGATRAAATAWAGRVDAVVARRPATGMRRASALLVRPDGYVAWASDTRSPSSLASEARAALARWCGAPDAGVAIAGSRGIAAAVGGAAAQIAPALPAVALVAEHA